MPQSQSHGFRRAILHGLAASIALALVTFVCFRLQLSLATVAALYLIVIVVLSLQGSFILSAAFSLVAVALLTYLFAPPIFDLRIGDTLNAIEIVAFLTTSAVITYLVSRSRKSAARLENLTRELRRREAHLAEAQRLSQTGSFGWTPSTGEIRWSDETFRIVQYDRTMKPTVEGILQRVHPQDADGVKQTIERASQDGKAFEHECRLVMPEGLIKHVHVVAHPLSDELGSIEFVGAVMDVTATKQAEAALRTSEEQWRDVFENNPTMYFLVDVAGNVVAVNPFGAEQLGYEVDELVGRPVLDVFPEPDREAVQRNIAGCLENLGQAKSWEARKIRKDGTVLRVRETAKAVPRADGPIVLVACEDITASKQGEDALREQAALLDLTRDAIFVRDANDVIRFWNRGAEELYGWTKEEAIGRVTHDLMQTIFPAPLEAITAELIRSGRWEGELVHTRRDGTKVVAASRWSLQKDDQGRPAATLETNNDITARKQVEAEKEHLEAQLRQSQKMEAVGTLAGGIAHDFNNILGAILGYGELAQKNLPEGSVVQRHLDHVMHAGGRGKALVERILAFSRSGPGERVPVHVRSVIEETLEMLAASLPQLVRLDKKLDIGDAAVVGDATQLHQVVMNLCTNAVQAMQRGGLLTVALECVEMPERRVLSHGTLSACPYVRLVVRDTGPGIPPAVLERMFDPFFTTKGVGEGTGLGLSLVHALVADLGGAIDVTTKIGEGTTFAIWLPVTGQAARPVADTARELPRGNGEAVMIVDDERSLVMFAEMTLAELGYEPAGFDSSVAALNAFRADPLRFDLVLTDETMPDLSGTDLAREIRRVRPDIPIVLMSGYSGARLVERAHAAGVSDVLHKPLVSRDIAEPIAHALAAGR